MSTPTPVKLDFFDPEVNDCPYHAYAYLRDEAPVWKDNATGMYMISRYEDIRMILLDTKRFSNGVGNGANNTGKAIRPDDPEEAKRQAEIARQAADVQKLYEEKGWVPAPSLDARDDPNHLQMRKLFDVKPGAFRPPPQVDSAFVRMTPHPPSMLGARNERLLGQVVTAAFTKRRKQLRNALAEVIGEADLQALGIDPKLRPENLSVADYVAVANAVAAGGT